MILSLTPDPVPHTLIITSPSLSVSSAISSASPKPFVLSSDSCLGFGFYVSLSSCPSLCTDPGS